MVLFMVFNVLIGPVFIFEPCSYLTFVNGQFPVTTLGLDLFSGAYLYKLLFLWRPLTENSTIKEVLQSRFFFAYKRKQPASETLYFFEKLDDGQSPQKRR
jgi:hypothetical protein